MSAGFFASGSLRRVDGGVDAGPIHSATHRLPHFLRAGDRSPSALPAGPESLPDAETAYVTPARVGDHVDIYQLLLAVFQGPSRQEFQAAQDDPLYEPTDRLLVKRGERVLSHLHLTKRTMHFGSLRLPIASVQWLATLPEYRCRGYASQLLHAADQQMLEDGALVSVLRTNNPRYLKRFSWALCGRHSYSRAKPRAVLSRLSDAGYLRRSDLNIRFWRHVELPSLMRIYQQNVAGNVGPLERSEVYWRWLISRHAYDHIIVALDGPDKLELEEHNAPIVGYAVVRARQVVELLTAPEYEAAGPLLLARACGDLIEYDDRPVSLHAHPHNPLHEFMVTAGGERVYHEADQGEVSMVKILDIPRFIKLLGPELLARAKQQRLPRPLELGFLVEGTKHLLTLTTRGARWSTGKLGRSYLSLRHSDLTRLLLGHLNLADNVSSGRITASTQAALHAAGKLFPQLTAWHPAWDDLTA